MPPDLNSLPPSPSPTTMTPQSSRRIPSTSSNHPNDHSTSPSFSPQTTSLAAAATMNAGLQNEERRPSTGSLRGNPSFERRRSSVRINLSLNDPTLPAPGELAMSPSMRLHNSAWPPNPSSPTRHVRQASLGELHQELENEQEAQVNRLLSMIRQQQAQIQVLQTQVPSSALNSNAIDDSESPRAQTPAQSASASRTPALHHVSHQIPHSLSRHSSSNRQSFSNIHSSSSDVSPALRPHQNPHLPAPLPLGSPHAPSTTAAGGFDEPPSGSLSSVSSHLRDEATFYQAETQMLTRENQMLKMRIRELERQVTEISGSSPVAAATHNPLTHSALHTAPVRDNNDDEAVEP